MSHLVMLYMANLCITGLASQEQSLQNETLQNDTKTNQNRAFLGKGLQVEHSSNESETAVLILSSQSLTCTDTSNWNNGWSGCGSESLGRWPYCQTGQGWTCAGYAAKGWCKWNRCLSESDTGGVYACGYNTAGNHLNYPEHHCCACGGGSYVPTPTPMPTRMTPPPTPPEFHGEFKLRNDDSGLYLSVDCWLTWNCKSRTNVNQYSDAVTFQDNRIFELQGKGNGVHLLKSKRGELWVSDWGDSVKLSAAADAAPSRWILSCTGNICQITNHWSAKCMAATGSSLSDDVTVVDCNRGHSGAPTWTLERT